MFGFFNEIMKRKFKYINLFYVFKNKIKNILKF